MVCTLIDHKNDVKKIVVDLSVLGLDTKISKNGLKIYLEILEKCL